MQQFTSNDSGDFWNFFESMLITNKTRVRDRITVQKFTLRGPEVLILAVMMHLITYILCITRVQMFYDRCFVKGRQEFKIQIDI